MIDKCGGRPRWQEGKFVWPEPYYIYIFVSVFKTTRGLVQAHYDSILFEATSEGAGMEM